MRFSILMTTLGLGLLQALPSLALTGSHSPSLSNASTVNAAAKNMELIDAADLISQKPGARRRATRKTEESSKSKTRSRRSSPSRSTVPKRRRSTTKVRSSGRKVRSPRKIQPARISAPKKKSPSKARSLKQVVKKSPAKQPRVRRKKVEIKTVTPTKKRLQNRKTVIRKPKLDQRTKVKVAPRKAVVEKDKKHTLKKVNVRKRRTNPLSTTRRRQNHKTVIHKPRLDPRTKIKVVPRKAVVEKDKQHKSKKANIRRRRTDRIKVIQQPAVTKVVPIKKVRPAVTKTKVKRVSPHARRKELRRKSDYSLIRTRQRSRYPFSRRRGLSNNRFRRVVRRRRAIPYWGRRRVRSRRLTQAYRPCYYCPGRGWSFTSNCGSRARRYYIYSDSYASLLPRFTSDLGRRRRSYNDQLLAERVEVAILDYAKLYDLNDLDDNLKITQDGSDIVLSGDVETEEILEDIVAIARDTEGVDDVITDDVIVLYPSESQDNFLDDLDPALENYEQEESELIFTAAFDDDSSEEFED